MQWFCAQWLRDFVDMVLGKAPKLAEENVGRRRRNTPIDPWASDCSKQSK